MGRPITLPKPPTERVLSFDEAIEVRGYNKYDMLDYAKEAVMLDREIQSLGLFARIWRAIRG